MDHFWLILGLGLAGIDPVGMLLLFSFLSQGLSRQKAILFGVGTLAGTTLLGAGLSLLLGNTLQHLANLLQTLPNVAWIWFNAVLVLALVVWGFYRLHHPEHHEKKAEKTPKGMIPALGFMIVSPLLDPTFIGMMTVSSQHGLVMQPFLDAFLWTLISQSPLFLLTGAVMFGVHEKLVLAINGFRKKYHAVIHKLVTALIFLAASVFLADIVMYCVTGTWLLP